jgi:hypothetical protein
MKIHLDKDTGIISFTIVIALLLMFSVLKGHAQGQSCKNILMNKKVQYSFEHYTLCEDYKSILKPDYSIPLPDTINKKKVESREMNSMKKLKRAVPTMLISQHTFDNNIVKEFCFLPGSQSSNYEHYEKNK